MTIPVVICGGGPVGLTLALGLAAWRIPVTLIERHRAPLPFPKGRALSIRTMEIYRQLGLESEITAAGLPRRDTMHFFYGENLTADIHARISNTPPPGGSPLSPTFTLACSQDVLETVLRRHANRHPLITARYGVTVADADIGTAGSTVHTTTDDGGHERFDCRWLVAADGANSTLRTLAGIERTHYGHNCDNVNILFEADLAALVADRGSLVYTVSNDYLHATLLTVDGRLHWLCNVIQPDPVAVIDDDWCIEQIHHAIGQPVDAKVIAFMPWNATASNAHVYRLRSLLLVGDAAHVATPYGGFGMNTGVADTNNMAWKLASTLCYDQPDQLIDTYHAERHPLGERTVQESARRLSTSLDGHRSGRTRRGEVSANPSEGLVLGGRYDSAAVFASAQPHPDDDSIGTYTPSARPGVRAPHAWLADGRSVLDLYGPHLTVLHDSNTNAKVPPPLDTLPTSIVCIDDNVDPDYHIRNLYELADGGAVIVRPDGHILWRTTR